MKHEVISIDGKKGDQVELSDKIFSLEINKNDGSVNQSKKDLANESGGRSASQSFGNSGGNRPW